MSPIPNSLDEKGARYFKADLHTHSPASRDFEDRKATPEDFVKAALNNGLEIIALTDHNSADWVDLVRGAAKRTPLYVFPGTEVSTPTCHILAIFDRDAPKSKLDDFLSSVGVTTDKRGKEDALSESAELVLAKIEKLGGIAIAAHANSTNGLLQEAQANTGSSSITWKSSTHSSSEKKKTSRTSHKEKSRIMDPGLAFRGPTLTISQKSEGYSPILRWMGSPCEGSSKHYSITRSASDFTGTL